MFKGVYPNNQKKSFALLIVVFLILMILLFRTYIVYQSDHTHVYTESGCSVCTNIQNAEYLLRQLGVAIKVAGLAMAILASLSISLGESLSSFNQKSLVRLKIRMNN